MNLEIEKVRMRNEKIIVTKTNSKMWQCWVKEKEKGISKMEYEKMNEIEKKEFFVFLEIFNIKVSMLVCLKNWFDES
jgi:hypothetical protein